MSAASASARAPLRRADKELLRTPGTRPDARPAGPTSGAPGAPRPGRRRQAHLGATRRFAALRICKQAGFRGPASSKHCLFKQLFARGVEAAWSYGHFSCIESAKFEKPGAQLPDSWLAIRHQHALSKFITPTGWDHFARSQVKTLKADHLI